MATITGYTAEKMDEFNNASVISGTVNSSGGLILKTRGGTDIDAGTVKGPKGDTGNTGTAGAHGIAGGTTAVRNTMYPLPTTIAAQATLANKVVTFYNTTTKMFETYYAKTGTAGLTVPGVAGASGWYENTYTGNLPKGLCVLADHTSVTPSMTKLTVITSIASFTFKANRQYEIEFTCGVGVVSGSLSNTPLVQLYTCAVTDAAAATTGLTELTGYNVIVSTMGATARANPKRKISYPVDTTLQIKATVSPNNNTVLIAAGETYPAQLSIVDLGIIA